MLELTTKQRFVEVTYQMIGEKGLENIKVRDIAKQVGCTAAALYKHFESFDYLIMLASIRYLEDYMEELTEITRSIPDPVQMDIEAWHAFNRHAFGNPRVFLHLFWGPCSSMFSDAAVEYYQLFPPQEKAHDEVFYGYYFMAAYNGALPEREFIWLRSAASKGELDYDDARYISITNNYIAHGMLLDHLDDFREPGKADEAARSCNALIEKTIRTFLKNQAS